VVLVVLGSAIEVRVRLLLFYAPAPALFHSLTPAIEVEALEKRAGHCAP
jgi:hypothetical protein